MNSGQVGEKNIFNHVSYIQNSKVENGISVLVILFWYCKIKVFAISGPWQGRFKYSKIAMDMYEV